jgi:hypothetical protein
MFAHIICRQFLVWGKGHLSLEFLTVLAYTMSYQYLKKERDFGIAVLELNLSFV